jgi:hypothetical protein
VFRERKNGKTVSATERNASSTRSSVDEQGGISEIILVGHNAKVFNIPWLMHQLTVHGTINILLGNGRFNYYGMDTLVIAKTAIKNDNKSGSPSAYNLPTLFQFVSGRMPDTSLLEVAVLRSRRNLLRILSPQ